MLAADSKHDICFHQQAWGADMNDSAQRKGGLARANKLPAEDRQAIASHAAAARWAKVRANSMIPEAETDGELVIGEVSLEVYVLSDRRRLINKKAMAKALQLKSTGGNAFLRTMTRPGIKSVISVELQEKIDNPIVFATLGKGTAHGYEAEVLIEVCDALIEARNKLMLLPSQSFLAMQAEIIVRAAAKLGIIALVDEATGYKDKTKDEYRKLFDAFVKSEFQQWEKEFPDKFFEMIYRFYGLKKQKADSTRHPQFFGNFIRKYVYYPLAHSNGAILEQLEEKNPVVYTGGGRRYKFFQFLTDQVGMPAFRQHLWQVVGIGQAARDKTQFDRLFYSAFPEAIPRKETDQLDFFDSMDKSISKGATI